MKRNPAQHFEILALEITSDTTATLDYVCRVGNEIQIRTVDVTDTDLSWLAIGEMVDVYNDRLGKDENYFCPTLMQELSNEELLDLAKFVNRYKVCSLDDFLLWADESTIAKLEDYKKKWYMRKVVGTRKTVKKITKSQYFAASRFFQKNERASMTLAVALDTQFNLVKRTFLPA